MEKRNVVIWSRHYLKDGFAFGSDHWLYRDKSDYTVRKVVIATESTTPKVVYQASTSPSRRSWSKGFGSFVEARKFALLKLCDV